MNKAIITCAVTDSVHTPSMSPHLPITPEQIGADAIAAAVTGAAMLYLHARDPQTGHPSPDADLFAQFLPRIRERTDAIINITTGDGHGMSLDQRLAAALGRNRRSKPAPSCSPRERTPSASKLPARALDL